ncbi:MAG TPA: TonB-dependent receptor [Sphingomonadaceae bacterium]|nr:TonB-dependent receptor [Sphingomonadaceae bacterium]
MAARWLQAAGIAGLALVPAGALAQPGDVLLAPPIAAEEDPATSNEGGVVVHDAMAIYEPAFFIPYAPRSALDMVGQLPGFTIDSGGGFNQARGLGQASGNVLLNGERIVTKSGSIADDLARIPAGDVIRIELVDGATLNIPGLSGRVANVIARSSGKLQGQFEWRPQMAAEYADARWLEGIVSVSGTIGRLGFTVAVEGRPVRNGSGGPNLITFGDGSFQERFSETKANGNDKRVSGTLRYQTPGRTVANLNASYLHRRFHAFEEENVIGPQGAPPLTDNFNQRNRGHDFEIGGDIDFALGPGRMKLIGLDSSQELSFLSQTVIDPATGDPAFGSRFLQQSQRSERIGRGEYSWAMWGADWQWSFEAAFNKLDQQGELFLLVPSGDFDQVPFPFGTGGVREDRYESLLSYGRPLTGNLSMQLIAGGEYSTISVTGSNANSRTFVRPKGSLSLAWKPQAGLDVSMRLERRVGQLNFGDFLAAVNLGDDNQNDANNELRPDQSWGIEIEATRDFGAWGSATLRTFMRRFEDFVTFIPTTGGGEARGNIAWARVMGIQLNGTLRLDQLGLAGAKIDLAAAMRDSIYPDPVESGKLPVQFAQPHSFEIDFRYDVPGSNWAFGTGYRYSSFNRYYRVAEYGLDHAFDHNPYVLIEHKDVFGLSVQARFNNLLNRPLVLDRSVFAGPRGSSPLLFHEDRRREVGRVVNLVVKGSF